VPDPVEIDIRQIEPGDRLTGLSLGDQAFTPLKIFLQKHAKTYHEQNLARTYGAFLIAEKPKVIGYLTLVCGEVVTGEDDNHLLQEIDYSYKHYPAVKIARLAVDKGMRDRKLGRALVDLALGVAKDTICPAVGCRFVVVDAKKAAVPFYLRCGFTLLDTPENQERDAPVMFVDLHKIPRPE
jgi:GNAT superfamily N-acetyltransferase